MTHFADLLIGDLLLTGAVIKPLVLTSRWAHQHFGHLLWRHIKIRPKHPNTDTDDIELANLLTKHSTTVRSLQLEGEIHEKYYDITFPRLLTFRHDHPEGNPRHNKAWVASAILSDFIQRHPTIEDITIRTAGLFLNDEFWVTISDTLRNPKRLNLKGTLDGQGRMRSIIGEGGPAFWRALSLFEEVTYRGRDQSESIRSLDIDCSRLKRLDLRTTDYTRKGVRLWNWMQGCRNLTRLHWSGQIPIRDGATMTILPAWPLLEDFQVNSGRGSEEELADVILRHLPPLKHLRLEGGPFGRACFGRLRDRHFETLRTLSLRGPCSMTSRMALDVLLNCATLEVLEIAYIAIEDLQETPQPWACRGLRRLHGTVESSYKGMHTLFFEQLSRLRLLEEVDLNGDMMVHYVDLKGYSSPRWRLDSGLGLLSTVTRLKKLDLHGCTQDLRQEDIEWMLNQWPLLERLSGGLSYNIGKDRRLKALIKKRGVAVEYPFA
ncbi:hypothetical protein EC957_003935 [Mortierella hygrophila]|uniref:Uncharacterized protein n=1 Tax=Mortierella hygrophila TaxID=979708 RepID=A0A9P6F354_9FUNG|nr:hypothetical protein EC957_003935 [Mortierella hygrophila]